MSFDGITLNATKQELEKLLINSRVDRVYQPDKETIILKFRTRSGNYNLLLSCKADAARIHLISIRPGNPLQAPVFCMVLRKHLEGGQLTSIEQQGLERILTLNFQAINEAGSMKHLSLHCEIMGKHSNIVLVDSDSNVILDGAKRFTHEVNRFREILPGIPYVLPPSQNKQAIKGMTEEQFYKLVLSKPLDNKLHELLLRILEGFSPLLCREAVVRTGLPTDMLLNECGEYELGKLWQELSKISEDLSKGNFKPTLVRENSKYKEYFPFDLVQFPADTKQHFDSMNETLDVFFQAKEDTRRFNEIKHRLEKIVNTQIKRTRHKLDIQEEDLRETLNAENDRIAGELITANMYNVSRGDRQLIAPNFYDPEQKNLVIELDPSRSPSQNAQRYFKKYRKAAIKKQKATQYIAKTSKDLLYLDTLSMAIAQATSLMELGEVEEELAQQGYIKKDKRKAPAPKTPGYLTYRSSKGFTIMVGKNNRQNDFLTMKVARDEDIWLHTKDIPGAHVIVRADGKTIPEDTLLEAAMLAAYYSKGKLSGNVPVDYALKEHVRKPKGAKPGLVIYDHQSTIYVTPLEERIKALEFIKPQLQSIPARKES